MASIAGEDERQEVGELLTQERVPGDGVEGAGDVHL
jgi:hypothetical protein